MNAVTERLILCVCHRSPSASDCKPTDDFLFELSMSDGIQSRKRSEGARTDDPYKPMNTNEKWDSRSIFSPFSLPLPFIRFPDGSSVCHRTVSGCLAAQTLVTEQWHFYDQQPTTVRKYRVTAYAGLSSLSFVCGASRLKACSVMFVFYFKSSLIWFDLFSP